MSLTKRQFLGMASAASFVGAMPYIARAQDGFVPSRDIQMIIMTSEGGGADEAARKVVSAIEANNLADARIIPSNNPGGSGAAALIQLQRARDPEHTLLMTSSTFFATPLRQPGLKVDILDFAPIARLGDAPLLLRVNKSSEIKDFAQFLAEARKRRFNWSMGGTGKNSGDHLVTEALNREFGLNIEYYSYESGGEVANALSRGRINSAINNPSEVLDLVENGRLVPLGSFTKRPLQVLGDEIPTISDNGVELTYSMQRAIAGGPRMSDAARLYYTRIFRKAFDSSQWQAYRRENLLINGFLAAGNLREEWSRLRDQNETLLRDFGAIK